MSKGQSVIESVPATLTFSVTPITGTDIPWHACQNKLSKKSILKSGVLVLLGIFPVFLL